MAQLLLNRLIKLLLELGCSVTVQPVQPVQIRAKAADPPRRTRQGNVLLDAVGVED